jgi:hypothetical protein
MSSSSEVPKKKVYCKPSLKAYGSLTEMTAAAKNKGQLDGQTNKGGHTLRTG